MVKARIWLAARTEWPAPCARCGRPVDQSRWHLGHALDRQLYPELTWDRDNWRVEHVRCSTRAGAIQGNRRRRATSTRGAAAPTASTPASPISSAPAGHTAAVSSIDTPTMAGEPRWISPTPAGATGSLWEMARGWLADQGITLRPWQSRVAELALAVEGDRLAFRTVVVSTPRQSGKSWLIKAMAMFRAAHPDVFGGEPQKVVHVANRHLAARRIHSQAWGWAGRRGLEVRTAQGLERIIWPDESSWDALTLSNVYGESANLVMLDEVWDVSGEDYREGLRPTQVARAMPQLWALSTAHRRATGLMLELMRQGMAGEGRVLLADWGAAVDADPSDVRVWASSSPWWDAQRAEEMRLVAGSAGFAEQWLNVWPASELSGPWLSGWWLRRVAAAPPVAAAVEAAYGESPVVVFAGRDGDRVVVSAVQCLSVADAARRVAAAGVPVRVGKSLLNDPAWALTDAEPMSSTTSRAVAEFRRLFDDGVLWHDGSPVLADQVAEVDVVFSAEGARVVSRSARLDAVKAAVWAVAAARAIPEVAAVF